MISEWIFKSPSCFTKGSLHGFHGDIQNECRCSHRGEHITRGLGVSVEHEVAQYFGITELFRSPPSSIDAFNSRRLSTEWVTKPTLLEIHNTFKDAESVVLLSLLQRSPGMTAVPQKARSAEWRSTPHGAGGRARRPRREVPLRAAGVLALWTLTAGGSVQKFFPATVPAEANTYVPNKTGQNPALRFHCALSTLTDIRVHERGPPVAAACRGLGARCARLRHTGPRPRVALPRHLRDVRTMAEPLSDVPKRCVAVTEYQTLRGSLCINWKWFAFLPETPFPLTFAGARLGQPRPL